MATPLEAAYEYAGRGWPTFPVHYPVGKGKCSCGRPDCSNPAKHPMTRHGLKDATTDRKQIKEWWTKHPQANVGIVTGEASGLVILDIDPRSGGADSLKAIKKLGNLPVTPAVYTGGGGEHIYMAYPNNGVPVKTRPNLGGYNGIDLKAQGGYVIAPPSRHISGGKYTWKRHHIHNKVAGMPDWFYQLSEKGVSGGPKRVILPHEACNAAVTLKIPQGVRDDTLFNLAKTLRLGGMPPEEVLQYIEMIAENCCDPPVDKATARQKVVSTFNAERNIGAEIKEWLALQKGYITINESDRELHIVTEKEKALRRITFHRAVQANILERVENRPGTYRVVESDLEQIDLSLDEDDLPPLDIKWPFGLENLVDILPKNIVICSGSKDAGKSAFCLNVIKMNMHSWDIRYFSSEMGAHELKRRLRRFDDLKISDWKFKAYMRASKFHDVIFPTALNIIDYLEVTKDFSLVAEEIRQIYDKLTTGIALVALQKDPKKEFGRGDTFSLEKSRMYLTLDRVNFQNVLTIKSGKNWHQEGVNPVGTVVKYKVYNGAKLQEVGL